MAGTGRLWRSIGQSGRLGEPPLRVQCGFSVRPTPCQRPGCRKARYGAPISGHLSRVPLSRLHKAHFQLHMHSCCQAFARGGGGVGRAPFQPADIRLIDPSHLSQFFCVKSQARRPCTMARVICRSGSSSLTAARTTFSILLKFASISKFSTCSARTPGRLGTCGIPLPDHKTATHSGCTASPLAVLM